MTTTPNVIFFRDNGGAAFTANDTDPNTTDPPVDQTFIVAKPQVVPLGLWIAATGGGPTIQIWMKVDHPKFGANAPNRWIKFGNAFALTADVLLSITTGSIPTNARLFLQITAHDTATALAAGLVQG